MISYGQAYVLESGTSLAVIFLSFGVGLDPRQSQVLGAALSPALVGLTVGLASFATGFVKDGWYGAGKLCIYLSIHVLHHQDRLPLSCILHFRNG